MVASCKSQKTYSVDLNILVDETICQRNLVLKDSEAYNGQQLLRRREGVSLVFYFFKKKNMCQKKKKKKKTNKN